MSHNFDPSILREYDIRGIIGETLEADDARAIGRSFGTLLKRAGGSTVAVGYDGRQSSPMLEHAVVEGLTASGCDVVQIGLSATPMLYYAEASDAKVDGGIQITGSHNPPNYNGFKMVFQGRPFFGQDIQRIGEIAASGDWEDGAGTVSERPVMDSYIERLLEGLDGIDRTALASLKVGWDAGNGAAGPALEQLVAKLPGEHHVLFAEVDGAFPNHHPDPTVKENLEDLIALMKTGDYDIGVAFDGDADRVGVVDETGEIIWADQLMALFLPEVIQNKGDEILYDVKCSQALEEMIEKYGGTPIMWKTGHSLIKQRMFELKCRFGGEMSGHIFFADDYYGYDDAIYVAARAVQMLSRSDKTLSEMLAELPKYYSTPELRLEVENDEEKFRIANEAIEYFKANYDCSTVDGVRIRFGDGWGLVRSSNTQPVIVCRFEANSQERMEEIQALVMGKLQEFGTLKLDAGH